MMKKTLIVEGEPLEADAGTPSRVDDGLQAALASWKTAQRDLNEARQAAANVATRLQQLDDELSDLRQQASQRPSGAFADFAAVKAHGREIAVLHTEIEALECVRGDLLTEQSRRQSQVFGAEMLASDSKRACWSALLKQLKQNIPVDTLNELPHTALMAGLSRNELTDLLLPSEDSDQCFSIAQKYGVPI